jgi:hypothetical protein
MEAVTCRHHFDEVSAVSLICMSPLRIKSLFQVQDRTLICFSRLCCLVLSHDESECLNGFLGDVRGRRHSGIPGIPEILHKKQVKRAGIGEVVCNQSINDSIDRGVGAVWRFQIGIGGSKRRKRIQVGHFSKDDRFHRLGETFGGNLKRAVYKRHRTVFEETFAISGDSQRPHSEYQKCESLL